MGDFVTIIYILLFLSFLYHQRVVEKIKRYANTSMIRFVYLVLLTVGAILCLTSNIFKIQYHILLPLWLAVMLVLNVLEIAFCTRFLKLISAGESVFCVITVLLLIITIAMYINAVYTSVADLSGIILLVIGSGMTSFSLLLSLQGHYKETV